MISGLRFFVIEGREDEREKLEAVAERFDDLVPEVARIWKSENERAVQMIVAAIDEIRQGADEVSEDGFPR